MRSWALAALLVTAGPLAAQAPMAAPQAPLRVFLDCQNLHCDFSFLRREITYVDWVRDRAVADVHVLVTSRRTGAGGREVTLTFIGLRRFAGRTDTTRFTTGTTDTFAEQRDVLSHELSLGLVPYAQRTAAGPHLSVRYDMPDGQVEATPVHDPWNYWVFRVAAGGSLNGQQLEKSYSGRSSLSARRVTESWKLDFGLDASYNRDEYVIDTLEVYTRTSWGADWSSVWSVGPHVSLGFEGQLNHSTYRNYDLAFETGPGVEYSVFPYDESSRREITFRYIAGIGSYRYIDSTIFGHLQETRPLHELNIRASFQQPWGNLRGGIEARQYLHDLSKHRIELNGGLEFRLVRGLSLNINGYVARVKDQINLAATDLTPAEILVEQRQLGTDYEYHTSISLSYTFGSIFNNVVNPRF